MLLVHGILHLCGYDHERGVEDERLMATREKDMMEQMGWKGAGLIEAQSQLGEELGDSGKKPELPKVRAATAGRKGESVPSSKGSGAGQVGGGESATSGAPGLGLIWAAAASAGGAESGRSNVIRKASVAAQDKARLKASEQDSTTLASSSSAIIRGDSDSSTGRAPPSSKAAADPSSSSGEGRHPVISQQDCGWQSSYCICLQPLKRVLQRNGQAARATCVWWHWTWTGLSSTGTALLGLRPHRCEQSSWLVLVSRK